MNKSLVADCKLVVTEAGYNTVLFKFFKRNARSVALNKNLDAPSALAWRSAGKRTGGTVMGEYYIELKKVRKLLGRKRC